MANNSSSSSGISFLGLLTILFIGLKLTGQIDWSWWWVLSPIIAPFAGLAVFLVAMCAFFLLKEICNLFKSKERKQREEAAKKINEAMARINSSYRAYKSRR